MSQPRSFAFTAVFVILALAGSAFGIGTVQAARARAASPPTSPPLAAPPGAGTAASTVPGTSSASTAPAGSARVPTSEPAPPTDPTSDPTTDPTSTTEPPAGTADGSGADDGWDYPLTPAELADWNRDAEGLAAYLTQAGVAFTRTVDPDGLVEIDWDDQDPRANAAVDEYDWQQHPLTPTEVHDANDETMALDAVLTDEQIDHTLTTDAHGVIDLEYDEDDDVANAIVEAFYAERE